MEDLNEYEEREPKNLKRSESFAFVEHRTPNS